MMMMRVVDELNFGVWWRGGKGRSHRRRSLMAREEFLERWEGRKAVRREELGGGRAL